MVREAPLTRLPPVRPLWREQTHRYWVHGPERYEQLHRLAATPSGRGIARNALPYRIGTPLFLEA